MEGDGVLLFGNSAGVDAIPDYRNASGAVRNGYSLRFLFPDASVNASSGGVDRDP